MKKILTVALLMVVITVGKAQQPNQRHLSYYLDNSTARVINTNSGTVVGSWNLRYIRDNRGVYSYYVIEIVTTDAIHLLVYGRTAPPSREPEELPVDVIATPDSRYEPLQRGYLTAMETGDFKFHVAVFERQQ